MISHRGNLMELIRPVRSAMNWQQCRGVDTPGDRDSTMISSGYIVERCLQPARHWKGPVWHRAIKRLC